MYLSLKWKNTLTTIDVSPFKIQTTWGKNILFNNAIPFVITWHVLVHVQHYNQYNLYLIFVCQHHLWFSIDNIQFIICLLFVYHCYHNHYNCNHILDHCQRRQWDDCTFISLADIISISNSVSTFIVLSQFVVFGHNLYWQYNDITTHWHTIFYSYLMDIKLY